MRVFEGFVHMGVGDVLAGFGPRVPQAGSTVEACFQQERTVEKRREGAGRVPEPQLLGAEAGNTKGKHVRQDGRASGSPDNVQGPFWWCQGPLRAHSGQSENRRPLDPSLSVVPRQRWEAS